MVEAIWLGRVLLFPTLFAFVKGLHQSPNFLACRGKGLGRNEDGMRDFIHVSKKTDSLGVRTQFWEWITANTFT